MEYLLNHFNKNTFFNFGTSFNVKCISQDTELSKETKLDTCLTSTQYVKFVHLITKLVFQQTCVHIFHLGCGIVTSK